MSRAFTMQIRVRYGECDPQDVVFNANYFAYFDVALTEAWREAIDDLLDVEWRITRLGSTSMVTRIDLSVDGRPVIEGEMRHVFIDPETKEKKPMPDEIRTALEPYAAQPAADSRQPTRQ
jgi:acyl-CoA thioester hydrolase